MDTLLVRMIWQNVHGFWSSVENPVWLIEESGRSRSREVGNAYGSLDSDSDGAGEARLG